MTGPLARRIPRAVFLAVLCIGVLPASISGQVNAWPTDFAVPLPEDPKDSSGIFVQDITSIKDPVTRSTTSAQLERNDSLSYTAQNVLYRLTYDPTIPAAPAKHFADLSGLTTWKKPLSFLDYAGLEWRPTLSVNRSETGGIVQGNADGGVTAGLHLLAMPIQVGGGACGIVWDSLPFHLATGSIHSVKRDIGGYGSIAIAQTHGALSSFGFDLDASLFGRSTPQARVLSGTGRILFNAPFLFPKDSLFLLCRDTLVNGNDAYLAESGTTSLYAGRPSINSNSTDFSIGLRGSPVIAVLPSFSAMIRQSTQAYPWAPELLRDGRNRLAAFHGILETDSNAIISYQGGIRFTWGLQDWLFNRTLEQSFPDSALLPLYNRNNLDCERSDIGIAHRLSAHTRNDLGFTLTLNVDRASETYPRRYFRWSGSRLDTIAVSLDNDRIRLRTQLDLIFASFPAWDFTLHGKYTYNIVSYLAASHSGINSFDSTFGIGATTHFRLRDSLAVAETLQTEVNLSRFRYPFLHTAAEDRPSYSRKATSAFQIRWHPDPLFYAAFYWNEHYDDAGKWYGREYFDSTRIDSLIAAGRKFDYYAIERITWDHFFRLTIGSQIRTWLALEMGCEYNDLYLRLWQLVGYEVNDLGTSYQLIPFVNGRITFGKAVGADLQLRPVLQTETADDATLLKLTHIDMALQLRMAF